MFDGAILAGGVQGLKNQQHSPFVLRVKLVLQLRKGLNAVSQRLFGARLSFGLEPQRVTRIYILQLEPRSISDSKWLGQLMCFPIQFFPVHSSSLSLIL